MCYFAVQVLSFGHIILQNNTFYKLTVTYIPIKQSKNNASIKYIYIFQKLVLDMFLNETTFVSPTEGVCKIALYLKTFSVGETKIVSICVICRTKLALWELVMVVILKGAELDDTLGLEPEFKPFEMVSILVLLLGDLSELLMNKLLARIGDVAKLEPVLALDENALT
ncbi:hypothetical protein BpHYR1_034024 [Brachionus plicatilis]|uniref:Uncharacterized protein n=1 Tax=Brachionus plicatilis TaxID=10195 RepID=A0A3M7PHU1_BRAPC|nr:hypothetical protein BpHYR1_034024 [Brachionus plicatilis]